MEDISVSFCVLVRLWRNNQVLAQRIYNSHHGVELEHFSIRRDRLKIPHQESRRKGKVHHRIFWSAR
jgi:hypothetical protein